MDTYLPKVQALGISKAAIEQSSQLCENACRCALQTSFLGLDSLTSETTRATLTLANATFSAASSSVVSISADGKSATFALNKASQALEALNIHFESAFFKDSGQDARARMTLSFADASLENLYGKEILFVADAYEASCFANSGSTVSFVNSLSNLSNASFEQTSQAIFHIDDALYDCEKSPKTDRDNMLCWAATASNILAWTGYGQEGLNLADALKNPEDTIFAEYVANFTNKGSLTEHGLTWFFDGTYPTYISSYAQPTKNSGNYLGFSAKELLTKGTDASILASHLATGEAAGLSIYYSPHEGGHAITCFGISFDSNYAPTDKEWLTGLYITDSDDEKNVENPKDRLRYVAVSWSAAQRKYYLDGYGKVTSGGRSYTYYLDSFVSLGRKETFADTFKEEVPVRIVEAGELSQSSMVASKSILLVSSGASSINDTVSGGYAHILSGAKSSGLILSAGTQFVKGSSVATEVYGQGSYVVMDRGLSREATIHRGAIERILRGGVESLGIVAGSQIVEAGGVVSSAQIVSGGVQSLAGEAFNTTVHAGGSVTVASLGQSHSTLLLGNMVVAKGGSADETTISSNGVQSVAGVARSGVLSSGGRGLVVSGGVVSAYSALQGATLEVEASGRSYFTTIQGIEAVSLGGSSVSAFIASGGEQQIWGKAHEGKIASGGKAVVFSSGVAEKTEIQSGGVAEVSLGGSALLPSVSGSLVVLEGAQAISAAIYQGGELQLFGSASALTVYEGGNITVFEGGSVTCANIQAQAFATISAGAKAYQTKISGCMMVEALGASYEDEVYAEGTLQVAGQAEKTTVSAGLMSIQDGGTALNVRVLSGGSLEVCAGGGDFATTLLGYEVVRLGGKSFDASVSFGGTLEVLGETEHVSVHNGGLLTVGSGGKDAAATVLGSATVLSNGRSLAPVVSLGGVLEVTGEVLSGTIYEGGVLAVSAGGIAESCTVRSGATARVGASGSLVLGSVAEGGQVLIEQGGNAKQTEVQSEGLLSLGSGATDEQSTIFGAEVVLEGAESYSARVCASGTLTVLGAAHAACVEKDGSLNVGSGGLAEQVRIQSGGRESIEALGKDFGASVLGLQEVALAAHSISATIGASGLQKVYGVAEEALIEAGGSALVYEKGAASRITIAFGGREELQSGSLDSEAKIFGTQTVDFGASALAGKVYAGGVQEVLGSCSATEVLTKGTLRIESGGIASHTYVRAKGLESVLSSALSDAATIWGSQVVAAGGSAQEANVSSGGLQRVYGVAEGTTVWGSQMVAAGGSARKSIVSQGGVQDVYGVVEESRITSGARLNKHLGAQLSLVTFAQGSIEAIYSGITLASKQVQGSGLVVESNATLLKGTVSSGGKIEIKNGGSCSAITVQAKGTLVVSGGTAQKLSVKNGGLLSAKASICNVTVSSGGTFHLASTAILSGTHVFKKGATVAGGSKTKYVALAKGGVVSLSGSAALSKLYLALQSGTLNVAGRANTIAALQSTAKSKLSYDLRKCSPNTSGFLNATTKTALTSGAVQILVDTAQSMGTYTLSKKLVWSGKATCSVWLGTKKAGSLSLGKALTYQGVVYTLKQSGSNSSLVLSVKAGKILKADTTAKTLTGTNHSDIFYGGTKKDTIIGSNGRDVAVYTTRSWGQDVIKKTSGTMTLLLSVIRKSDVTIKDSGSTRIITRKSAPKEKITIQGWTDVTHNIVYTGTLSHFTAYAQASKPTKTQLNAARNEVLKKTALA